jgi:23S rRNA pseudouridine2604 synthase
MHIRLDKLAVGKWRYLSEVEMETLQESVSDSSAAPQKVKMPAPGRGKEKVVFEKKPFEKKKDKKGEKKVYDRKTEKKVDKKPAARKPGKQTTRDKTASKNSRNERKEKPVEKSYKAFRDRGKKK